MDITLLFLLSNCLGVELLGQVVGIHLITTSEKFVIVYIPPCSGHSRSSIYLPILSRVSLFNLCQSNRYVLPWWLR